MAGTIDPATSAITLVGVIPGPTDPFGTIDTNQYWPEYPASFSGWLYRQPRQLCSGMIYRVDTLGYGVNGTGTSGTTTCSVPMRAGTYTLLYSVMRQNVPASIGSHAITILINGSILLSYNSNTGGAGTNGSLAGWIIPSTGWQSVRVAWNPYEGTAYSSFWLSCIEGY